MTKITLSTTHSCAAWGYKATLQYMGSVSDKALSANISVCVSYCLIHANVHERAYASLYIKMRLNMKQTHHKWADIRGHCVCACVCTYICVYHRWVKSSDVSLVPLSWCPWALLDRCHGERERVKLYYISHCRKQFLPDFSPRPCGKNLMPLALPTAHQFVFVFPLSFCTFSTPMLTRDDRQ